MIHLGLLEVSNVFKGGSTGGLIRKLSHRDNGDIFFFCQNSGWYVELCAFELVNVLCFSFSIQNNAESLRNLAAK